jgi:hypothetical protein
MLRVSRSAVQLARGKPGGEVISPELRATLDARNLEMETTFVWHCGEEDLVAIASGYVPNPIKALARQLLSFHDEELRKIEARELAATRTRKPKRKGKAACVAAMERTS